VNVGLLGDISVGKTSLLRLFVRYVNKGDVEKVEGGKELQIVKTDFSGEATVPSGDKEDKRNEKETKTIHPNRLVFRDLMDLALLSSIAFLFTYLENHLIKLALNI
ncbi:unnamed protein product, partial [marine sediment metagenome]